MGQGGWGGGAEGRIEGEPGLKKASDNHACLCL